MSQLSGPPVQAPPPVEAAHKDVADDDVVDGCLAFLANSEKQKRGTTQGKERCSQLEVEGRRRGSDESIVTGGASTIAPVMIKS
jgi:hypothetical protein